MKTIHIRWAKIYKYKSLIIDWHEHCGPTFLRHKDHEPKSMNNVSMRQWGEFSKWLSLNEDDREKYRI